MSEKFTVWWVEKTTDKGVNRGRRMFFDEKEAINYAKKHGFEPPKKYVAKDLMDEIAIREQMVIQEQNFLFSSERWMEEYEKKKQKAAEVKKEPDIIVKKEPGIIVKRVELELQFRDDFVPGSCNLCPFYMYDGDCCALEIAMTENSGWVKCPLSKYFVERLREVADERVAEQLEGCENCDKSFELFVDILGFSSLLPCQNEDGHRHNMIEAFYRVYNKNPKDKIKDCYIRAINRMALYFSSSDAISQLKKIVQTSMTIEEATDVFFNIAIKQLAFEKDGTAPFVVDEMEEFLQIFVKQIKENPELPENKDLIAKIRKYANHILQEYGLNCGDLL